MATSGSRLPVAHCRSSSYDDANPLKNDVPLSSKDEAAPDITATTQDEDSSINVEKPASCLLQSDTMKVQESITHVDTMAPEWNKSPGKRKRNEPVLKLHSGSAMQPHPYKDATGGEDACFIEGTSWVGVADGVGTWAADGVDAGLYSRELMSNCRMLAKKEKGIPDPKSVIIEAVKKCTAIGSCTVTVAALYGQTLYVANIGDSGFLLVRNGHVISKSHPMHHEFNCPLQVGTESDDPSVAETYEVKVDAGDVLVVSTDGVFDNLFEERIVELVQHGLAVKSKPEVTSLKHTHTHTRDLPISSKHIDTNIDWTLCAWFGMAHVLSADWPRPDGISLEANCHQDLL